MTTYTITRNLAPNKNLVKGLRASHRKDSLHSALIAIDLDTGDKVAEARFYWPGRTGDSRCYCCLWVTGDEYTSGSDYATGCGYHKPSAALQGAINHAGLVLLDGQKYAHIGGAGDEAMIDAMSAIAVYAGAKRPKVFQAHP